MARLFPSPFRWRNGTLAIALGAHFLAAQAVSMQVAPVRMLLTALRPIAAMTIGNGEETEVAVQAEVLEWSQENGTDVYKATQDVLVNPSIFRIAGESQQIVRVGLRVPGNAKERSYRIFLQQLPRDQALPVDGTEGASLQTLLRIGVPIFVPPSVALHEVQWRLTTVQSPPGTGSSARYALVIENRGNEHVQLTHVMVRSAKGDEIVQKSLSHYVLAGQSSTLPLDLPPITPDTELRIEARSDAAVAIPAAFLRVPRGEAKLH